MKLPTVLHDLYKLIVLLINERSLNCLTLKRKTKDCANNKPQKNYTYMS